MSSLTALSVFFESIKESEIINIDEAKLKQSTILRIFSLLGWDIFNHKEIIPEYTISGKKVDYALSVKDIPKVFIEVKRPGENLSNHQEQLLNYAFMQGIRLAVLTNGLTWWFYLPLQEANWEQRKFDSIDITRENPETTATKFTDYLSKTNIENEKAIETATRTYRDQKRKRVLDEAFPQAWDMVVNANNPEFLDLLNINIEGITGFRATQENLEKYVQLRQNHPVIQSITPISVRPRQPENQDTSTSYWIISAKERDSIVRLVKGEKIWAFGNNTGGRSSLKTGDSVCFYLSKKGIVAHAKVASPPSYQLHQAVKTPEKYPWVFQLTEVKTYIDTPIALTKDKRTQLDAFRGKTQDSTWGWFVQGSHTITQDDFYKIIKTS